MAVWYLTMIVAHVIQIEICAEYRDMQPRPSLVCQEPGLRPIGRSPGVPDKSSRSLGSMFRYCARILIYFIACVSIFIHLWFGLGTLQDCHHAQCPLPFSIAIKLKLFIRQSKFSVQEPSEWWVLSHAREWRYCISAKNLDWLQECWNKVQSGWKIN